MTALKSAEDGMIRINTPELARRHHHHTRLLRCLVGDDLRDYASLGCLEELTVEVEGLPDAKLVLKKRGWFLDQQSEQRYSSSTTPIEDMDKLREAIELLVATPPPPPPSRWQRLRKRFLVTAS